MPKARTRPAAIHSTLASDPELADLVQQFVSEMPGRVAWMGRYFESHDLPALRGAVHQLKGAAGSYGFERLTPFAQRLEELLDRRAPRTEICPALDELVTYCRRVTAEPEV